MTMEQDMQTFSFGAGVGKPVKTFDGDGNEIWKVKACALPANVVMRDILFEEGEIRKVADKFAGVPVIYEHPGTRALDLDSKDDMMRHYMFAHVEESHWNDEKKRMDYTVAFNATKARGFKEGKQFADDLEAGRSLNCSVSLAMKKIPAEGKNYTHKAITGKPNHVAVLYKTRPAASQAQDTVINFMADGDVESFSMSEAEMPVHQADSESGLHYDEAEARSAQEWLMGLFRKSKEEPAMADQTEDKAVEAKAEAPSGDNAEIKEMLQSFSAELKEELAAVREKVDTLEKAHKTEIENFAEAEKTRREEAIKRAVELGVVKDASAFKDTDRIELIESFSAGVEKDEAKAVPADTSKDEQAPDGVENFSMFGPESKEKE